LPPFGQPAWDGSPLGGRTILLHAEQGLGDTLQFIRYAPLVQQRGGTVLVQSPAPLARLLARCPGVDRLVAPGPAPTEAFDVHAPLLGLPGLLGTSLATVPARVPYLFADAELTAHWRQQLGAIGGFTIGIAWQGNPRHPRDRDRSIPLLQFAPLAGIEGVRLLSLQKGPGRDQLAALAGRFPVTDLSHGLDDFLDTAAVLMNLDLVITADTALAHLAGALGVPVWVALPFAPDWRWLLGRENNPWYPTMRLFRQAQRGNWESVFDRIVSEVSQVAVATEPARISRLQDNSD
jgi:hypothetical protein